MDSCKLLPIPKKGKNKLPRPKRLAVVAPPSKRGKVKVPLVKRINGTTCVLFVPLVPLSPPEAEEVALTLTEMLGTVGVVVEEP